MNRTAGLCRWAAAHARTAAAMALVALGILGAYLWVRDVTLRTLVADLRATAATTATPYAGLLVGALNERLALVRGLAAFVTVKAGTGDLGEEFPVFADALRASVPGIRNMSASPGFVVRHVNPLAGNASVLGNDLLKDPRPGFADTVRRAVETADVTTHGPLKLIQGGTGLIARAAIRKDGEPWGAVGVVLDLQPILDAAALPGLGSHYAYGIRTDRGGIVDGDPTVFDRDPIVERIHLPDAFWELGVVPVAGWQGAAAASADQRTLSVAFAVGALLALAVTFLVAERRVALERLVGRRTAELVDARGVAEARARDLAQFAHAAAHDLQEPARTVGTHAQLLARQVGEEVLGPEGRACLRHVLDGSARLRALLHDVELYLSEDGEPPATAPIAAEEALRAAREELGPALARTGAEITAGPLPAVLADGRRLRAILVELLGNAMEYRHPARRPSVHVTAAREGDRVLLFVADNGIGIEPQYLDQIFQVFRRLHGREEHPGTGMGLAIARKMAERLGGGLAVRSEPGRGSTFTLTLPAVPGDTIP